jgi:hypothetical protein
MSKKEMGIMKSEQVKVLTLERNVIMMTIVMMTRRRRRDFIGIIP